MEDRNSHSMWLPGITRTHEYDPEKLTKIFLRTTKRSTASDLTFVPVS